MKKLDVFKTIQLVILAVITAIILVALFTNKELFHQAANDSNMRLLLICLWIILGLSFVFVFLDFTNIRNMKKNYKEMDAALRSDPMSGIANRFSCDIIIEKYLDKPLPRNLGCIMFDLTNIREINDLYGHRIGNNVIREFSGLLSAAADSKCFVGRNGGNKFLAIFEKTSPEDMSGFLSKVKANVDDFNTENPSTPISYAYGCSYQEDENIKVITDMIALANSRIK